MTKYSDITSQTYESLLEIIPSINSISDFRKLLESEKKGKNRKMVKILILRRLQLLKLEQDGFNIELIKRLLDVPFYSPDRKKANYTEKVKKSILERDGYVCQVCYAPSSKLHVHHVDPNGSALPDNLITLCQSCHGAIHRLLRAKGYSYYV